MTQTKKILSLLNENGSMTQGKLAEAIYGDKLHGPNIYSALMTLVNSRRVIRTGAHPALYSLADGSANEGRRTLSDDSCFVSANIKSVSMSPEEAVRLIREYYNETIVDPHGRYLSWVHCYKAFCENRNTTNEETIDHLALHLAFYLASWGMYRGSSFLLQKDYKVHIPVVRIILEEKYNPLLGISAEELQKKCYLALLNEISMRIRRSYAAEQPAFDGTINNTTNTLVTKILLGTLGCVPAYDRYYVQSVKNRGISSGNYNSNSVAAVARFYCQNIETFEKLRKELSLSEVEYPPMKLMDMCFWQDANIQDKT